MTFSPTTTATPRAACLRCFRPQRLCLCSHVGHVANRTPVLILQHRREQSHPFNTARLAELTLARCTLRVGYPTQLRDRLAADLCAGAGLLYPHPRAINLADLPPQRMPQQLVVLDGTWHHARVMYRDLPELHRLPHFTLPPGLSSGFRIRKQPAAHCLSTLEAIYYALRLADPSAPGLAPLLDCFEQMQLRQLNSMVGAGRHKKNPRSAGHRRLPRALLEDLSRLVVAYGECDSWQARGRRRLLTWAAHRPFCGSSFSAIVQRPPPDPEHLAHLRLTPTAIRDSVSVSEFRRAWAEFSRPDDVLATWHAGTASLLQREGVVLPSHIALKSVYLALGAHRGTLEDIARAEGLSPSSVGQRAPGRTGSRLGNALAMVDLLRSRSLPAAQ